MRNIFFLILVISVQLLSSGCGGTGTGNASLAPAVNGAAAAITTAENILTGSICAKLNTCFPSLTVSQCYFGILPVTNLASPFGLSAGFGSYQAIINAEVAGTITPVAAYATTCKSDIAALSCASSQVTTAYSVGSPTNFNNVVNLIPTGSTSCAGLY